MGLFNNWQKLVSGFPSVMDWNRYTKAIAGMRGQNGIRVYIQNGQAVVDGSGIVLPDHPFRVYDSSAQGSGGGHFITMRPGFVAAQGCTDQVPIWAGAGTINVFPLVSQAVPYDSTLVLIDVEYDSDEVWQSTEIRLENGASFSTTDTYLNGYLLVATLTRVTSADGVRSVTITQGITASQSHTKCNIYHSWTATGQVPSVVGLNVIFPQLAADPSPEPSAPYVYYNTTSDTLRLWNGAAWSTL